MPVNDWIAAGRSGAQSLADAHRVIRNASPKYGETYKTGLVASASEQIAELRANERIISAKIDEQLADRKQKNVVKAMDEEFDRKVGGIRKAGYLAALGGAASGVIGGYMNKQDEKRQDERDAKRAAAETARIEALKDLFTSTQAASTPTPPPKVVPIPPMPEPGATPTPSASDDSGNEGSATSAAVTDTDIRSQVYSYLTNRHKLSRIHALGIMANIDRESSFRPSVLSGDDGGYGGLFQWLGSRQTPKVQQLVKTGDWKGQIDHALTEPMHLAGVEPGLYARTQFKTPQESSYWWMKYFERPADLPSGDKRHADILATYNF